MLNRHHDHHHTRRHAHAFDHAEAHESGRGHHHRGRGGRRSSRLFDYGELRLVILALIAEQPRHGYELIKAVEERSAGTYSPSPGVIYPTLSMLQELGHATVEESDGKKLYAVTTEGTDYLNANRTVLNGAMARIDSVRAAHGDGPARDIVRATENLKLALRMRQERGPLSENQVRAIAAALDHAAVTIERS
jgi:DNA-binding PadR family transcriptional regulator